MNEEPRASEPQSGKEISPAATPPAPSSFSRLGFPTGLLVVYWALYFLVDHLEKPYFYGFIYGMGSSLLFAICFLVWWWFNRAIRIGEKLAGFFLILAAGIAAGKFAHPTINILTLLSIGVPLAVTLVIAWMALVRRAMIPVHRLGFAVAVVLAWAPLLCIRTDGFDSYLQSRVSWRWTPTAEQRFLAQNRTNGTPGAPASAAVELTASSWPEFRGTDRDGVVRGTNVETDWKATPPVQLWRHAVGPAWSSVIVVAGRLYTQEQRGAMETVVCYDCDSGAELWIHEDATRFDESVSGPGPRATPTFAQGRIFALGATGILNCLDAATGKLIWTKDIKIDGQSKPPIWGLSSSPLVVRENVIVYGGGTAGKGLLAYRADSGQLVWTAPAGEMSYSSPQLTSIAGVAQCLMYHNFGLTSVDPATGRKLWEAGLVMPNAPRCSQPHLFGAARLAVATLDGPGTSLIEISKDGDQWKVTPVWASKDLKPEFPDFVVHGTNAYGFDGSILCCLDLATGKRTWKDGPFGRGQVILLEDQGLFLVLSETGEVVLHAVDAQSRKELGRFQALNGKTWNHPVVAHGRLYVRNAEEMACYNLVTNTLAAAR